jgi:hypothetical protein
MLRRDFIALLGSAAIARPLSVLAEQGKSRRLAFCFSDIPIHRFLLKGFGRVYAILDTRRDEASS